MTGPKLEIQQEGIRPVSAPEQRGPEDYIRLISADMTSFSGFRTRYVEFLQKESDCPVEDPIKSVIGLIDAILQHWEQQDLAKVKPLLGSLQNDINVLFSSNNPGFDVVSTLPVMEVMTLVSTCQSHISSLEMMETLDPTVVQELRKQTKEMAVVAVGKPFPQGEVRIPKEDPRPKRKKKKKDPKEEHGGRRNTNSSPKKSPRKKQSRPRAKENSVETLPYLSMPELIQRFDRMFEVARNATETDKERELLITPLKESFDRNLNTITIDKIETQSGWAIFRNALKGLLLFDELPDAFYQLPRERFNDLKQILFREFSNIEYFVRHYVEFPEEPRALLPSSIETAHHTLPGKDMNALLTETYVEFLNAYNKLSKFNAREQRHSHPDSRYVRLRLGKIAAEAFNTFWSALNSKEITSPEQFIHLWEDGVNQLRVFSHKHKVTPSALTTLQDLARQKLALIRELYPFLSGLTFDRTARRLHFAQPKHAEVKVLPAESQPEPKPEVATPASPTASKNALLVTESMARTFPPELLLTVQSLAPYVQDENDPRKPFVEGILSAIGQIAQRLDEQLQAKAEARTPQPTEAPAAEPTTPLVSIPARIEKAPGYLDQINGLSDAATFAIEACLALSKVSVEDYPNEWFFRKGISSEQLAEAAMLIYPQNEALHDSEFWATNLRLMSKSTGTSASSFEKKFGRKSLLTHYEQLTPAHHFGTRFVTWTKRVSQQHQIPFFVPTPEAVEDLKITLHEEQEKATAGKDNVLAVREQVILDINAALEGVDLGAPLEPTQPLPSALMPLFTSGLIDFPEQRVEGAASLLTSANMKKFRGKVPEEVITDTSSLALHLKNVTRHLVDVCKALTTNLNTLSQHEDPLVRQAVRGELENAMRRIEGAFKVFDSVNPRKEVQFMEEFNSFVNTGE